MTTKPSYCNIIDHAEARRREWLTKHGKHERDKHNLLAEALEEMADAWNYLFEAAGHVSDEQWTILEDVVSLVRLAWQEINRAQAMLEE